VGQSAVLRQVLRLIETVATGDRPCSAGRDGTGKELIARAIHNRSRRKERNFVKLNCAAIPRVCWKVNCSGMSEEPSRARIAQKVGRLELADRGSLFLDEIGDIP